jgi:hypothetical protein
MASSLVVTDVFREGRSCGDFVCCDVFSVIDGVSVVVVLVDIRDSYFELRKKL